MIVQSSSLYRSGLNLLPSLQDLFLPTVQDVGRGHVAQRLVISPIVVVAHEVGDGRIQVCRSIVWDLVHIPFDRLVISLQLAVGLRMIRRSQNVTDAHQVQIVSERTRCWLSAQMGQIVNRDFELISRAL